MEKLKEKARFSKGTALAITANSGRPRLNKSSSDCFTKLHLIWGNLYWAISRLGIKKVLSLEYFLDVALVLNILFISFNCLKFQCGLTSILNALKAIRPISYYAMLFYGWGYLSSVQKVCLCAAV